MKDYNIVNIINKVKESNWIENEPINVPLTKIPQDAEKKLLHKISFGKGQELEVIFNYEQSLIRNICYCEEEDELYAEIYTKSVYTDWTFKENKIIPFSSLSEKHIIMIAEKLSNDYTFDQLYDSHSHIVQTYFSDFMISKIKKHQNHIKCIRINFIFLDDDSFIYDYNKFNDHIQAMRNAVDYGENLKELISLIYPEKMDQGPVYQKIINNKWQKKKKQKLLFIKRLEQAKNQMMLRKI